MQECLNKRSNANPRSLYLIKRRHTFRHPTHPTNPIAPYGILLRILASASSCAGVSILIGVFSLDTGEGISIYPDC